MKKYLSIFLVLTLIIGLAGCGTTKDVADGAYHGALNGGSLKGDSSIGDGVYGDAILPEGAPMEPGGDDTSEEKPQQPSYIAGTLTAGEWKDVENLDFWKKLLNRNDWYQLMEDRNLYTNDVIPVYVHDAEGNPCYNVTVKLVAGSQELYIARTGVDGKAWLVNNVTSENDSVKQVVVGTQKFEIPSEGALDVAVQDAGIEAKALDLMFMVDTTGSMGDELKYLQVELEDVIKEISQTSIGLPPQVLSLNISVNFYRDESDEYVVRPFEFTSDVQQALKDLRAQNTDGGGDYPEAVHKALDNAINQHQWRNDAVKLMFFVLDAPPHSEKEIQGIDKQMTECVMNAAEKGIRIIPIASSGVNTETEFLLRSWTVMTGGTYLFLTDHSGVGNSHLEPTVGEYEVKPLNAWMLRVINYYIGVANSDEPVAPQQ